MNSFGVKAFDLYKSKAFLETLELLEWPRLCAHISEFASTVKGKLSCKDISLPIDLITSQRKLAETIEIGSLDSLIEGGLSFQGVHDLDQILIRCAKGGVVSGEELLEVADTLATARRLRRQINDYEIRPILTDLLVNLVTFPELERKFRFGLEEGGRVANRASKDLENLRLQYQSLLQQRNDLMQQCLRRYSSFLQDTVISERNGRPVIASNAKNSRCPPSNNGIGNKLIKPKFIEIRAVK